MDPLDALSVSAFTSLGFLTASFYYCVCFCRVIMFQRSYTRRRSPNLTVSFKETERSAPSTTAVHHYSPWNKYSTSAKRNMTSSPMKLHVELSQPSREEYVRIRNWSIERQKFEDRQAEHERQRRAVLERRQTESLEATLKAKRTAFMEDARRRQEKRATMQRERTLAQERYTVFRQSARVTPLLHELRQNAFEQALKQSDNVRMELYNSKIKPFRTMRPGDIVKTNILQELGRCREIEEKEIPFELKMVRNRGEAWKRSRSLPPPSVAPPREIEARNKTDAATETTLDSQQTYRNLSTSDAVANSQEDESASSKTEHPHSNHIEPNPISLHEDREAATDVPESEQNVLDSNEAATSETVTCEQLEEPPRANEDLDSVSVEEGTSGDGPEVYSTDGPQTLQGACEENT